MATLTPVSVRSVRSTLTYPVKADQDLIDVQPGQRVELIGVADGNRVAVFAQAEVVQLVEKRLRPCAAADEDLNDLGRVPI